MQLRDLLDTYRQTARDTTEQGGYFERLVRVFFENDDLQKQHFSKITKFSEWARERGWVTNDTGIDLVGTLADNSGFAAIQCKFYAPDHTIQKPDIDSFISAASNDIFTRLIIVDMNRPGFTGGQNSRRISRYGTDTKEENREALFTRVPRACGAFGDGTPR